jgi:hypothetical protein
MLKVFIILPLMFAIAYFGLILILHIVDPTRSDNK